MKLVEILHADHKKNHSNSQSFLTSVEEILSKIMTGYELSKYNNTLILHKMIGSMGDGMEFHCYNAERGQDLAKNVLEFLNKCREMGLSWAMTPYQNPKINELFKTITTPEQLTITKTDAGFEATVRL